MTSSDVELEQRIKEIGKQLSHPPDSVEELLTVLDKVEKLLSKVDQSPKRSMIDALKPSMRALMKDGLSKHSDVDVKVAVASCISEITRITAPDAPYYDNLMRDAFKLIVSTFEGLADQSSRSYAKRASILETASEVKSWVVMLDLECDALIVEMFEHFLKSVRDYHLHSVFPSMESIMVLVIEESDEIPVEMLKPLLAHVKKDNTDVLPIARNLSERVLVKSAEKLKPYLLPAITALGESLDTYTKVVTAVCKGTTATNENNDENTSGLQEADESKLEKGSVDETQQADECKLTTASSDQTDQFAVSIQQKKSKAQQLSLTTLPPAIIETILCLLPTAEAARTSILSREWRYKWTKIPKLVFFHSTPIEAGQLVWSDWAQMSDLERARIKKDMRCKLFHAIHQVLLLRQGPIHEFTLLMNADRTCFELDQILLHLSGNHTIKKLTLKLHHSDLYGLPLSVFSFHHLTDLHLENCAINHKPIFNGFGSLTSLTLNEIRISRETLLHLLSNFPSLKSLYLLIYEEQFVGDEYPFMEPSNMELFKCLPVIEHLTTSGYLIMSLVQASIPEELPALLIHLKSCTIEDMCFVDAYGLPFLADLIKCSPNLEKLKLEINADCCIETKVDKLEEHSVNLEEYSDVWLEHLNELEIKNFCNYKSELEFVKFILARSPNLKKVMLVTWMDDKNEEFEMLKILLRVPRASPVEISVDSKY